MRDEILAGIVLFHPDEAELTRLLAVVAPDVREVIAFSNSPLSSETKARLVAANPNLRVLEPGGNAGLGAAYNAFAAHARSAKIRHLLLLDQDSLPAPGMIPDLATVSAALERAGERPAIVGPRPVGADGRPLKIPVRPGAGRHGATRVAFVISSGSLVDVEAAASVGEFRTDFFIDAIDIEWCMRAEHAGYSIWVADAVRMDHRLGRGVIRLPFGIHLADQPPQRLYTYLRNQIAMLRLGHVPLRYKIKTMVSMPARLLVHLVRNRFSGVTWSAILRGLGDGAANRLGPPRAP